MYILILWCHSIGDFLFQPRQIAENKSKSIKILFYHCLLYMIPFIICSTFTSLSWYFSLSTGLFHFPIDYITSKITSHAYQKNNNYLFFTTIGIDQAIHFTILFILFDHI